MHQIIFAISLVAFQSQQYFIKGKKRMKNAAKEDKQVKLFVCWIRLFGWKFLSIRFVAKSQLLKWKSNDFFDLRDCRESHLKAINTLNGFDLYILGFGGLYVNPCMISKNLSSYIVVLLEFALRFFLFSPIQCCLKSLAKKKRLTEENK